ncbi:MAG: hypothetical protein LC713_03015 [Actinobacteria bacterium]|nr:hypothetical protein [Actinomycetota bacterium]
MTDQPAGATKPPATVPVSASELARLVLVYLGELPPGDEDLAGEDQREQLAAAARHVRAFFRQ